VLGQVGRHHPFLDAIVAGVVAGAAVLVKLPGTPLVRSALWSGSVVPSGIRLARNRPDRSHGLFSASSHWVHHGGVLVAGLLGRGFHSFGDVGPTTSAFAGVDHRTGQDFLCRGDESCGVVDVVVRVTELVADGS
jgi:hypothetical protein